MMESGGFGGISNSEKSLADPLAVSSEWGIFWRFLLRTMLLQLC